MRAQRAPYWGLHWASLNWREQAQFESLSDFDLLSEWRFGIALLALMNSRNMVRYEDEVEFGALNRKREKQKKPGLLSYRPITINLSKVQKRRLIRHALGDRKRPDEPQFVVGHLKVRKTGIFWWSPHTRLGDVQEIRPREYKVTA